MNVWVTRPQPGLTETSRVLRAGGHDVVAAAVLQVVSVPPDPVPAPPWPDWVVLVSANAARGLAAATATLGRSSSRFAAVGERTAEVARALGFPVTRVPAEERAEGLLAALATEELTNRRVWIPAGDRPGSANRELPAALAGRGAVVTVFRVYETRDRALLPDELAALAAREPAAVLLHSPSAADAVYRYPHAAVAAWRERAAAVAIGPVTRVRLEQLGANRVVEAPEPSDRGVLAALAALEERPS